MTHSVQTSIFNRTRLFANHYYLDLYQAVINTEDGESYEYEVEADSFNNNVSPYKQSHNYGRENDHRQSG